MIRGDSPESARLARALAFVREADPRLLGAPVWWAFDAAVLYGMLNAFGAPPAVAVVVLVMLAAYLFLMTRIVSVAAAVATTEGTGPLRIIRRSWALTSGHFWRLLGFLLVYLIGTGIAEYAVISVVGTVTPMLLGNMDPMSASALVLALVAALANGIVIVVLAVMLARIYVQLARRAEAQPSVPSSGT